MRQKRLKRGLTSFQFVYKLMVKVVLLLLATGCPFASTLPASGDAFTAEASLQSKPIDLEGNGDNPISPSGSGAAISRVKPDSRKDSHRDAPAESERPNHSTNILATGRASATRPGYTTLRDKIIVALPVLIALATCAILNRVLAPDRKATRPVDRKAPEVEPVSISVKGHRELWILIAVLCWLVTLA